MKGDGGVAFLDLSREAGELAEEISLAFRDFLERSSYILGPEVAALEREFSSYCGCREGVGVGSGTDALVLALRAAGVKAGDEVIVPALSAPPTAVAVALAGARPVFADVDPVTYNIDPRRAEEKITPRTRCLVAVHLFGRMAPMKRLCEIAEEHGLVLLEDCAQAHGASLEGRKAGSFGLAGCYSFYPTKNLGALGDGGMVVTDEPSVAEKIRSLRNYGKADRDRLESVGMNSRLDELQALFLRLKLKRLDQWNRRRRELAKRYMEGLSGLPLRPPAWDEGHCFHLFVVECGGRDRLRRFLTERGVETMIHYPVPLHLQPPFLDGGRPRTSCPVAERAASRLLSLPLYPQLREEEQDRVMEAVHDFFRRKGT